MISQEFFTGLLLGTFLERFFPMPFSGGSGFYPGRGLDRSRCYWCLPRRGPTGERKLVAVTETPLKHGHPSGERLVAARHATVGRVVRDQRTVPGPDGRRGRGCGPGVRPTAQHVRPEQLVQLVPDVRVHPAVDDRVGHRRRHGGQVADG